MKIYWANILKRLRKEYGLTQGEIAEVLHTSRQTYNAIEKGRLNASIEDIIILSNIYDIDIYSYAIRCMPEHMLAEQQEFKLRLSKRKYSAPKENDKENIDIVSDRVTEYGNTYGYSNAKSDKELDVYIDPLEILLEDEKDTEINVNI